MTRRLFVLSIAIAALCVVWFALRAPSEGAATASMDAVDRGIVPPSAQVELVEPPSSGNGAESNGAARVIAQSIEVAEPIPKEPIDAPTGREWLEGIVEFPPGTPADEHAFVSVVVPAINHDFRPSQPERFPVVANGSFRVAFPQDAWNLELDVIGRFVHTPTPFTVNLNAKVPPVVLRPKLGACVRVRIVPSKQLVSRGLEWGRITFGRWRHADGFAFDDYRRTETTGERGIGEVGGLDIEYPWRINASALGAVRSTLDVHGLRPGELREITLQLEPAPRFSGLVHDERGAPIYGAQIRLAAGMHGSGSAFATSDEDGSFHAYVPETGATRMRVKRSGYADRELGPWDTAVGTDVADLDITLSGGAQISGVVRWPAGSAVSTYQMFVRRGTGDSSSAPEGVLVQKDGTFSVLAVANEPCTLSARVRARMDPADPKSRYDYWIASATTRAPATDIVLVPSPGSELRGRVVDDLGEAVPEAEVWSIPLGDYGAASHLKCITDASGAFVLRPVPDGSWTLYASAPDHAFAQTIEVEMPVTRAIELVVSRTGMIEGRVVDARAEPAGGADVELEAADESNAWHKYFPSAKTAGDGTFRLERVPIGTFRVSARRKGHARSLGVVCKTAGGETTSGVEIALRDGGTIDARLLDADGTPISGEEVLLRRAGVNWNVPVGRAWTDEQGSAHFEHVDPGTVSVTPPYVRGCKPIAAATVVVVDGMTTSIVLRH